MSKSTRGIRVAGVASLAVTLSIGVAAPAIAAAGFEFSRLAGDDRYETAVEASEQYGASDDVIIANGQPGEYADALAGNYLAGAEDAPILLTKRSGLPDVTKDRLATIDPTNVWIVGGTAAVPAEQEAELEAAGYNVERLAGDDRFGTNAEVIAADGDSKGGVGLIATGLNFPDALAAGPFAYQGHSLGLVRTNRVPDVVGDALEADGVTKVLIFGGTDVVGAGVVSDLAARGITVEERFDGADRSETSELAAEWAVENLDFTDEHVGVASGYTDGFGADALAGGPVEGNENSPMLITRNVENPDDVIDYLKNHCSTLADGHIYGGPAAISAAAEAAMTKAATECAAAGGQTDRPELVSARIVDTNTTGELGTDGTTIEYTFDEDIATAANGTPPVASLFHAWNSAQTDADGGQAGSEDGDTIVSVSGRTVQVRFEGTGLNTDAKAAALTLATVDYNAVEDASGAENPEGDAPLNATSGGGTTNLPAGVTQGPDLTSVGGFADATGNATDVEFVFDEAANYTGASNFSLIYIDETKAPITGDTIVGGNGTTTVIVRFSENVERTEFARGVVQAGAAVETTDNESDGPDSNPMQAADVSNGGNSGDPDLVSVALQENTTTTDRALFTFDENIATADAELFSLYKTDTSTATPLAAADYEINSSDAKQVLVTFPEGSIDNAVGGQVDDGAVEGTDGNLNEDDEVGVANTGTTSGQTAGRTNGPDLIGVTATQRKDNFGNVTGANVTYTFDEALEEGDVVGPLATSGLFRVYMADGTRLTAGAGACDVNDNSTGTTTDDTTVTCQFTGPTGDLDQAVDAVLGTVDNGAVTEDGAGSLTNPEGAEPIS